MLSVHKITNFADAIIFPGCVSKSQWVLRQYKYCFYLFTQPSHKIKQMTHQSCLWLLLEQHITGHLTKSSSLYPSSYVLRLMAPLCMGSSQGIISADLTHSYKWVKHPYFVPHFDWYCCNCNCNMLLTNKTIIVRSEDWLSSTNYF